MLAIQEFELTDKKELRERCIGRIDILDKVKQLFLIPNLEMMTTQQVADYYEVGYDTIRVCHQRNKEEIEADGAPITKLKFLKAHLVPIKIEHGKSIFQITDDATLVVPNCGIRMFSKRAILRIGMLLRDSKVAKEVRTQLLNTLEHATNSQRIEDIDTEVDFVSEIGKAYMDGDIHKFAIASQKYIAFQNRHIARIEEDNRLLASEILEWTDRASLNKAVRILAGKSQQSFASVFNHLYDELRYKNGIGLSQRGDAPLIQYIREEEWGDVMQTFSAICQENGFSPSEILERAKVKHSRL